MTTGRTLTITMTPDWRAALRRSGKAAQADSYQGETLNFESPGAFFGRLTERRWSSELGTRKQSAETERVRPSVPNLILAQRHLKHFFTSKVERRPTPSKCSASQVWRLAPGHQDEVV
jgi:hypothetical protein